MKQKMALCVIILCVIFLHPAGSAFAATYIAEPVLITQPAYFGNSFYMYRPSHTPAGSLIQVDSLGNVALQEVPPGRYAPSPETPMPPQQGMEKNSFLVPQEGPSWLANRNFMMVSTWKGLVDRMGILYKPKLPIAWKGETPQAIFVWTGKSWWQIHCKDGESPQCALQRNMYALTKLAKEHQESWSPEDTGFLANQAALWGYYWMAYILPECR